VEEEEEEPDVNAFGGQAVSVAGAIALKQAVSFELAEVIAELVESVIRQQPIPSPTRHHQQTKQ
jgi:hypothetical protein